MAGTLFAADRFVLVAGPCVLEDAETNLAVADHVRRIGESLDIRVVFKASFDKANRTSGASPRGPGLEAGARELARVRESTGLPVITDVHETEQVARIAPFVDALQIPAFLCRQTDLLSEAGRSGLPVNVKKGQWMAPGEMAHAVAKVRTGGCADVAVTERGTAFGYGRWIVDMRSFAIMHSACGCPVLFDATHSVQLPASGEGGKASGGEPEHIHALARAAVAAGADGLFVEVHPDPSKSLSDGDNMLPLHVLEKLVENLLQIQQAASEARQ